MDSDCKDLDIDCCDGALRARARARSLSGEDAKGSMMAQWMR